MNDQPKSISKKNWQAKIPFALACLATLIALFYIEEDWRGKSDWENYKREAEAKGAKLDWANYIPVPVPDDQNFAMSPVWIARIKYNFLLSNKTVNGSQMAKAWYGAKVNNDDVAKFSDLMPIAPGAIVGTNWANHWNVPVTPEFPVRWTSGRMFDLKPWQRYYRNLEETNPAAQISINPQPQSPAADVLLVLGKFDPVIEQLQQDGQKPYSRFPVQYDDDDPAGILLPHLAAVKQTSQVLELRAIAELQSGQTDKAFDDTKLMLRLIDSIRTEPFIISHLVRMAILQMTVQVIYEGLAEHQWSDAQLAGLDSELAKLDFAADYHLSVGCDYAANVRVYDWIEQKRSRTLTLFDLLGQQNDVPVAVAFYLAPKGWFYQADLLSAREDQCWDSAVTDDGHPMVSPAKVSQAGDAVKAMFRHHTPFNLLGRLLMSWLNPYPQRTAFAQESADLARAAVALERYHLAMETYPDSLDALAPRFMQQVPPDVINGQPLNYRRTSDGQFVLYSVGWNGKDDGGIAARGSILGLGIDIEKGDWVWRYPNK